MILRERSGVRLAIRAEQGAAPRDMLLSLSVRVNPLRHRQSAKVEGSTPRPCGRPRNSADLELLALCQHVKRPRQVVPAGESALMSPTLYATEVCTKNEDSPTKTSA